MPVQSQTFSPTETNQSPTAVADNPVGGPLIAPSGSDPSREIASNAASTTRATSDSAQIDPHALVEELRLVEYGNWVASFDFSLECPVAELDRSEQRIVAVDACPVCNSEWARPHFVISPVGFQIVDCVDCGLGRLHPHPRAAAIRQFYPPSYYGVTGAKFVPVVETLVRLVGTRHVQSISRDLPGGARVLDVGCGRGVLLSALADRGYEVHGFEISDTAAAGADPRADIRIGQTLSEVRYPDACFDQVIIWHVLEHLPDPRATLEEIWRILKPGGRLVVAVPNYSSRQARLCGAAWFHLDPPRHLFHFPVDALKRLLVDTDFACREEHHFSLRQNPFGWLQSLLNRVRALPRNGLYTLLKSRKGSAPRFHAAIRLLFRLAYWIGMPIACVLSVIDAVCRSGASVCIVAEKRRG